MIVYRLQCGNGHAFEGWFAGIAAFDRQKATGKLLCPVCNSRKISKAPMAPALAGGEGGESLRQRSVPEAKTSGDFQEMRQFFSGFRKYVEEHADYVGKQFPEEARKIHYGEADAKHIYGEATLREVADLVEEGIEVAPLPPDPAKSN